LRAGFGIFTVVNLGQLQNNNESNPAVRAPIAMSTQRSSATAVASLETHCACAEAHILTIANSFEPDEPLRHSFLDAAPVRRVLDGGQQTNPVSTLSPNHSAN
jgi:hypothetical protein